MEPPLSDTIAARLTAEVPAAIATVAISGPRACHYVRARVRLASQNLHVGQVYYGTWQLSLQPLALSNQTDLPPAEQVVVCRTADDTVEVHCHGGAAVCQAILQDLADLGCKIVTPGSWPSQLHCPLAIAAEHDLLRTTTDRAAALLLDQMQGALRQAIKILLACVRSGDTSAAIAKVRELLRWSDLGLHLSQPWKIVLAGPPNVGKSSLMNALVGTQQAIVHHEPGTTRDWIESAGAIDGLPVLFMDTAGIRAGEDSIEQAGVERSKSQLQQCDLAIFVVDAQQGWTEVHEQLLKLAPTRRLLAWNKMDLCRTPADGDGTTVTSSPATSPPASLPRVATSAVETPGVTELLAAIAQALFPATPPPGAAVLFRVQHVERLLTTAQRLQAGEMSQVEKELTAWLASSEK